MEYKDLSLKKYLEIKGIDSENELEFQARVISILYDMEEDDVLSLGLTEYGKMVESTAFLLEAPRAAKRVFKSLVLNGTKYKIDKSSELCVGQYIDYQTYTALEDSEKYTANILACFLIPEGKDAYGERYDMNKVVSDINEYMSVQDVIDIAFFLRRKSMKSINDSLFYLEWILRMTRVPKEKKAEKKETIRMIRKYRGLLSSGDGHIWLTGLAKRLENLGERSIR